MWGDIRSSGAAHEIGSTLDALKNPEAGHFLGGHLSQFTCNV
jgi:hypothetical protein